ncbi:Metal-binding protein [Ralstonia mannitolilytica]|uniref:DUF411 domain-containing protein n=1 Tax=Ralstonia mannitolilytica TaxID=105219 RepID=UPI0007AFF6A3|nr:DUF411 domain-containing protein [Ralstonia mannitolilytica]ANA35748.1 metal-binding protein [Ralstonia mannitolilytica]MBU9580840.1 DUF411 domain-containing protein [Ralstonia mannitolilytica]CAJ0687092.1 hypothetical protein R82526_02924 [Ralstonia mannitolilytica]CAJ0804642.1 hypothetical protein R77555_04158 [Ralstonia mannitolilytica]
MDTLNHSKRISHARRAIASGLALLPLIAIAQKAAPKPSVQVWKTASCGCCKDWVSHLKDNGFDVAVHDVEETVQARRKAGIPDQYASCHTGIVQGYALEGHVPAREIKRLLRERPKAVGLAVPSMPLGAPGMDGPAYGNRTMPFNVLLILPDGSATVYQAYS